MNFVGFAFDIIATFVYYNDYLKLLWDFSYLLDMLEVINYDEARPVLLENEINAIHPAVSAPQLMFFATSKLFVPLLFFFVLGTLAVKSMWEVIVDNERMQVCLQRLHTQMS